MNATLALDGRHLCRRFAVAGTREHTQAIADVSLQVAMGSLAAMVGPDGAGKTTLLRMAAGLIVPDAGTLTVLGIDVAQHPQAVQDRISYMPQRFGLYDDLSVQENLDLYADLHGVPADRRQARYAQLMAMTNLGRFKTRLAGQLSGGMKQKLGLACTLVRSPELLLLDEPTVGVDPLSRRELWEIVQSLVTDEQLTVIVSTAYLDEAERCSQVFLLRQGKLLAAGDPASLRQHAHGRCFIVTPPAGRPARWLQGRLLDDTAHVVDAVPQAGEVRTIGMGDDAEAPAALLGLARRAVPARLEDGFMVLLKLNSTASAMPVQANDAAASPRTKCDAETMIEVRDLVRKFGDFVAVANTTFSVRRGEVFGLLGPNGAGKTTTFRMLCGLLPATSGSLSMAGIDLRHARAEARRRIGYVAQKFSLYGNLTVAENLRFFAGAYGLRGEYAAQRMATVTAQFDLDGLSHTPSGQLPGGYRQRLAMATALLHEPQILFLDEPTSGADPLARREFWRRITALAEQGTTVVVTTHFMEEAEYCDRIVIQDAGHVLALGTPLQVRQQAQQHIHLGSTPGANDGQGAMGMEAAFIAIVEQARQAAGQGLPSAAAVEAS
ncbi:ATP-binding cassette domain-containing protein [Paucibacter sp. PLA-PC-4]|uniref:ATP-binding cassette domain-containing protein n=1 Tax=Paucibacter sp. PLA-PC-4 TaxID=2993655 RepID=UPI00224AFAFA|nr:ATP-binding cassette domain-containing protein [Paucibacter sp. PLA-PC-4]MCX2865256.1 ATP-binding cassette domain-containing protein [Paucibacter sp. PLA-PC-4]